MPALATDVFAKVIPFPAQPSTAEHGLEYSSVPAPVFRNISFRPPVVATTTKPQFPPLPPAPIKTAIVKPRALYLYAGLARKSDVGEVLRARNWEVEEMDILRNAKHDLSKPVVRNRVLSKIRRGHYTAVIGSPPCDTFSRVTFANNLGPKPLRSFFHRRGFPWLLGDKLRRVRLGNILGDFAFEALEAQSLQTPGFGGLEFPEDLGAVRGGQWAGVRPASLWQWDALSTLRKSFREFGILQSDFGAPYLKPTRILLKATPAPATLYEGPPTFDNQGYYTGPIPRCSAKQLGLTTLARQAGDSVFRTTGTAAWPDKLCAWMGISFDESWKAHGSLPPSLDDSDRVGGTCTTSPGTATFPVFLPQPGFWIGGSGPPRQTYMIGNRRDFHDGAGLTSPGRWHRDCRNYPQGKRWDELRDQLYDVLLHRKSADGSVWGSTGQLLLYSQG